ncbi:alpha/beta hydrolase [Paenibacillus provencensis]|uniref:Alpha/beta hydrolase n=1 Tax=Paenibacillus provencensis TaxID=441151 RepID=A0ABW3PY30_9BACL|nr:alpha/beta hydrolase family protein [Paenibacillus sp. MER 78]MCM3128257.1 esterase family protein [Paenibacillus sp. MER 78]
MAFMQCHFYSEVLGLNTTMHVILPQQTFSQIGVDTKQGHGPYPTLYLLHGLSDDDSIWLRRTSIERYASAMGIAVVMPNGYRSFYTDMAEGSKYYTYITEEVPKLARSFFPLSSAREDNFVAGLSMGGYGAMKIALSRPEEYAAAASLSGAVDMAAHYDKLKVHEEARSVEFKRIFGDKIEGTENDLLHLLKECDQQPGPKPKLFQCCGTEDFLYEDNLSFRSAAEQTRLDFTYTEGPGEHEWGYWDARIQDVLNWLPLQK